MTLRSILLTAAITLGGAAAFAAQAGTFRVHAYGVDAPVVSRLRADLVWAERHIRDTLGEFPDTVGVRVHGSRDAFTGALRDELGIEETACWMVGAAGDHTVHLLSPDVWAEQACEHDARDTEHVRMLVTHEAVHVFHGQLNPAPDLGRLEEIGWFTEGLATYVSGQLAARHAGRAAAALESGPGPARLVDAWSGPDRYGVAGSMIAFIDDAWEPGTLQRLLRATSQQEILDELGTSEAAFLADWRRWVRSR
ncbi:MAG: hypothetical protein GWM90_10270 [Gemmatimonadetes bacterium]|nr:hypothetical protein [Gemmatimonadota bacterium]NIQ54342.1 hypothetical protein [Gemmatimonadota bacterium]NIU74552.1 hypothetical protein [Gammaproteobacteria bacterium]NIX44487.1 hypothetical protein [Gemmatimonadota bacterium]NIY08717.1 hypothetical protein [Gemmatimonadota bacterium]